MSLDRAKEIAEEYLRSEGLAADGWTVKYDNAVKRFGVCNYRTKTIGLSRKLVALNNEPEVRNTITHEVAHALTRGAGHGRRWQEKHRELGGNGKARYGLEEVVMVPLPYTGTCPAGHTVYRTRLPRRSHSCGACTRKYDERYIITFTKNG